MSFLAKLGGGIMSLFSTEGAGNTALKIVEKISGTDWTPQQQAQFVIDYQNATKHLSLARRFIALSFTVGFALFGFIYLSAGVTAYFYVFFASSGENLSALVASQNIAEIRVKPLLQLQNDCVIYAKTTLLSPISIILGFYFAIGGISKLKS